MGASWRWAFVVRIERPEFLADAKKDCPLNIRPTSEEVGATAKPALTLTKTPIDKTKVALDFDSYEILLDGWGGGDTNVRFRLNDTLRMLCYTFRDIQ